MILVATAGSSSLKLGLFDSDLREVGRAQAAEIDDKAGGHAAALTGCLAEMGVSLSGLRGVAQRVVQGGAGLTAPCRITDGVRGEIAAMGALAPL
ncbi:MAG: acetate/propionate family kinase, partial [Paracoccaceae bacterium]